jgi:hypothetical protein
MKLKKLIKVINPHQPIRFSAIIGGCTRHCEVFRLDDKYYKPFVDSLGECKVLSIRNVYDELQLPDYQDIIEIKLQGGN